MSYQPVAALAYSVEEQLVAFFDEVVEQAISLWNGVSIQTGLNDASIEAPCVICFVEQDDEAAYATTAFKVTVHLQLQSWAKNGATVHRNRVAELEWHWQSLDAATPGNYTNLAAALTNHDNNVHVYGVVPGRATESVDGDLWIFDRTFDVYCQWVRLESSSSMSSSSSSSSGHSSSSSSQSSSSSSSNSSSSSSSS